MIDLVQTLLDGLATGSIYSALALALVLVFRTTGTVNLAQGELATFSAFAAWQLMAWGWAVWPAILGAIVLAAIGGALLERTVVRPFEQDHELSLFLVTLGVFLGVNSLTMWIWGYTPKKFPNAFPTDVLEIGDLRVPLDRVLTIAVLVAALLLLYGFFRFTATGLAMRAVVINRASAELNGINAGRMVMIGWAMSCSVGALAATLVAPRLFLEPNMMFGVLIFAFAAATVGGFDSFAGALVGGLFLGVVETLAGTYIDWIGSELKILVALVAIVGVLFVRPQGLFGTNTTERV